MARDTPLGFPAHTLPYCRGEFTTLSTVSHPPAGRVDAFGRFGIWAQAMALADSSSLAMSS